jgi:tRNA (guanine37-N1)-methyltransferase
MIKPKEVVLSMFAGVAPFPIAMAKRQPKVGKIYSVEINPDAHRYALENVMINHVEGKVFPILKDIRDARDIGKANRITMNLPEKAIEFLDEAFYHSKKGTIIHMYGFSEEPKFKDLEERVAKVAKKCKKKYKIVGRQDVLPYAPHISKVRLDIKVL